jgi:hypothetical protein
MPITVKHSKVSTIPDAGDSDLVRPSDWNADHTLIGLGTAAELDAGVPNGVATLDAGGKVPVSELPAAVLGALSYQGTWNASTNTPTLASSVGTKGYYYVVSVAGSTDLNGVTDWQIGDWAVYNGTAWQKVDNTDAGGDVVGPASSTDNAIARFDSTTGKLLQNSVVIVGDTGVVTGVTELTASTKVVSPHFDAQNSAGGQLRNASGTAQLQWGGGGGNNISVDVAININPANAQVAISPTGTGSVTMNPATAGTINNMSIGATTASTGAFTTLGATGVATFSAGTVSAPAITTTGDTNTGIFFPAADTIAFTEGGVESMRIDSSGNVGIGGASIANYKLGVYGDIRTVNAGYTMGGVYTPQSGDIGIGRENLGGMVFATDGTERMRISSTGNVGIGTTSPNSYSGFTTLTLNNASSGSILDLNINGTRTGSVFVDSSGLNLQTRTAIPMLFVTNATERMRIGNDGNIAIGTSTTFSRFRVAANDGIGVGFNGATRGVRFEFSSTGTTINGVDNTLNTSFQPLTIGGSNVRFSTSDTERMRLDASGNLGLGVTPSAWGTSFSQKALQVGSVAALSCIDASTGNRQVNLINNAYFDNSTYRYITSDFASFYQQIGGVHKWSVVASGTAGDAITFSESMRISNAGNVGIGISSPTLKLDVQGSQRTFSTSASTVYNLFQNSLSNLAVGVLSTGTGYIDMVNNYPLAFYTNDTERMRIDSSGNLLVGGTTNSFSARIYSLESSATEKNNLALFTQGAHNTARIALYNDAGSASVQSISGALSFSAGGVGSSNERMRIDSSGNLLVGTTTVSGAGGFSVAPNSSEGAAQITFNRANTGNLSYPIVFFNNSVSVGNINFSNTTTTYATSSDYRLKTVIAPVTNSGERIDALKPIEYDWNTGGRTRGFLAHQFAEIYPSSVTGEKDAVDEEGKPVYQGMQASTSEVMADLIAEIQSLRKRVAQLESK